MFSAKSDDQIILLPSLTVSKEQFLKSSFSGCAVKFFELAALLPYQLSAIDKAFFEAILLFKG